MAIAVLRFNKTQERLAALRSYAKERNEMPATIEALRALVKEMWDDAEGWSGPTASSHYRSKITEKAQNLGVKL
jgi:hypothetical protein